MRARQLAPVEETLAKVIEAVAASIAERIASP